MSPAKKRGKYVTINHVGFVAGLAAGLWYEFWLIYQWVNAFADSLRRAGYFITFWKSKVGEYWGWRTLELIQLVPSLAFAAMLPCIPET